MALKPSKPPAAKAVPKAKSAVTPTRYTPELADEICWLISQGDTISSIDLMPKMPAKRMIYTWLAQHDDFAALYAQAKEARADARAARIDELTQKLLRGEVDPASAKVAIDAEKWLAAKEKPKAYADRLDLSVSQSPLSDMSDEELDERFERLIKRHGIQAITQADES
jgi:hypothetical protein